MKEITAVGKKISSVKSHPKCLKCSVYLDIQAVSCPGAILARQEDVYLSVRIMGQCRKTRCFSPEFPLLFHHKMLFVKTFPGVVDPADVCEQLGADTTSFELIQLVPPEGKILSTVEENTRDFLFPGAGPTSRDEAPEREILMKSSSSFIGISPKVSFATSSVIEETDGSDGQLASPSLARGDGRNCSSSNTEKKKKKIKSGAVSLPASPSKPPPSSSTLGHGSQRNLKERLQKKASSPRVSGYLQPTVASQTRALSPYTHRRMCQLSEDARQRLRHLNLGPHRFKKETESRPPFLVSYSRNVSVLETPSSQRHSPPPRTRRSHRSFAANHTDPSLLGSYKPNVIKSAPDSVPSRLSPGTEAEVVSPVRAALFPQSSPDTSPSKSSFRQRCHRAASSPSRWEQIHSRIQRILQTHGTDHNSPQDEEVNAGTPRVDPLRSTRVIQDRHRLGESSVHLDDGNFRSNEASHNTERPHRIAFEDSLAKIYKSMYTEASLNNSSLHSTFQSSL